LAGYDNGDLRSGIRFLSLTSPTPRDRRLAFVLVVLSSAIFVAIAPFAKVPLASIPAFIPAYQAALFINDLITAVVLLGQYLILRTRAQLFLTSAYLFTALIIVPHTLTFPGIFAPGGLLGAGPETTSWLYVCWHAGFPLLVLGYVFTKHDQTPLAAPRTALLASVAAVAACVILITIFTTVGQSSLPVILENNRYTSFARGFMPTVCGFSMLTLAALLWRRPHSALDLWMIVVMVAWVFEVAIITMLIGGRYDLGFYGSRAYGLLAASFVLVMLLLETHALYVRQARALTSERADAEAALARSDERFRYLFLHSPLPKWVYSIATLNFLEVNDAAISKYGYSRAEFLSMTLMDIRSPEEVGRLKQWIERPPVDRFHTTGWQHRRKDGQILDVELFLRDIEFEGEPARLAVVIDITARRQAERQAERIFETSQDLILVTDSYGTYVKVSPSSTTLLGYRPEEMIGRNGRAFVFPDDLEAIRNEMRAARRGRAVRNFKSRYVHKDGHVVVLVWTAVWSEPDRRHFFIGRDMTEYNRTEEQLRQALKMEAVGQLTGGVAHDFNNILMVIMANIEVLEEEEKLDPSVLERIKEITKATQRAAELTRQLLAFSRKQALRPQRTDINDLVAATGKLLRRTLGEQIEIDSILADDLWSAEIDRIQLESALVNLSINARDAMPQGGRLLIETRNTTLDDSYVALNPDAAVGDYVMLAVTDTGSGMPPEIMDKVFDPFFTTKGLEGTGLGLSMVYGFIKQSNGHIKIYSEVGRGTSIKLYLPRNDGQARETATRQSPPMPRGSERILVVEDDGQVRAGVVNQLKDLGYAVTDASEGAAGLVAFEAAPQPPALLLTDVVMPGPLNGKALADEVIRRWPKTKVVYMSGYTESVVVHQGRLGADVLLLSKPFRKSDLARMLRQALDGPDESNH
jgi:PAS domain S-box-containing protein